MTSPVIRAHVIAWRRHALDTLAAIVIAAVWRRPADWTINREE